MIINLSEIFFGKNGDLLPLRAWRGDLHAEDDVTDLGLRKTGHVHVVLLAVVSQDQVLERHFDLEF
jgi:hypothetical protein